MSRYTKRHYVDAVSVIAECHARHMNIMGKQNHQKVQMLTMVTIEQWAKKFQHFADSDDTPGLFDRDKFVMACLEACGINWRDLPIIFIPNLVAEVLAVRVSEESE